MTAPAVRQQGIGQHYCCAGRGGLGELLTGMPTSVAFNGVASQYLTKPLEAKAGEPVRFYFINASPNDFAAFHVIGAIFDRVYESGNPGNVTVVHSVTGPPGGAIVADLTADAGT